MRTICVGDIHGCLEEMDRLVQLVDYRRGRDRLVLVGDLVDRGPDSVGVIRRAIELGAECVMGNHDEKHVRHMKKLGRHQDSRVGFTSDEERDMHTLLSEGERAWLSSLPSYIRLGRGLVAVHAGLLPRLPVEEQPERVLHRCRYLELKGDRYEMARMKITDDGGFLRPRGSIWWTLAWYGQDSVVYGHNVNKGGARVDDYEYYGAGVKPACWGIDTGACFGYSLTAAVFDDPDEPLAEPEFVSVDSRFTCDRDEFYEGEYDP